MGDKLTVLLVDDHALVRHGFRRILEDDAEIEVVGEASTGEEAVRLAAKERPAVIVMDCALPGMNGLEATRKILAARPEAAILMLSMHSEDTLVRQALDAGARGYILKNAMDLDLANAVKRVAKGEQVLDPQVARPAALKGEREGGLTPRELEVLQRIVAGKSNKEIATELNLSANTVSVHRANIMDTLVRQALDAGARGYILKNAMDLDLANAVKRVAKGEKVLDPQVARPAALKGEREGGLTPRELEVLQRIVAGKSNKEIAGELNLSANTVSVHRANIMDALGIHKTAELVVYAIRNGLVNLP